MLALFGTQALVAALELKRHNATTEHRGAASLPRAIHGHRNLFQDSGRAVRRRRGRFLRRAQGLFPTRRQTSDAALCATLPQTSDRPTLLGADRQHTRCATPADRTPGGQNASAGTLFWIAAITRARRGKGIIFSFDYLQHRQLLKTPRFGATTPAAPNPDIRERGDKSRKSAQSENAEANQSTGRLNYPLTIKH